MHGPSSFSGCVLAAYGSKQGVISRGTGGSTHPFVLFDPVLVHYT